MFSGCTAWFSDTVEEDKIENWRAEEGLLESYEVADFLFSADATHNDTAKIFESKDFCDGCLSVFHPDYISACIRCGGRLKVNLGRYDLPPEEVQNYMRSRGDRFQWEEEDTDTSEKLGAVLDRDAEFKDLERCRANDHQVPVVGHDLEPNESNMGSEMDENLLHRYKHDDPEYYAFLCENPDSQKMKTTGQKSMESKKKQNTKLRLGSPLSAGVSSGLHNSATNKKRADMSNMDAKAPRRSSPRQHQNDSNKICTEIPKMYTTAQNARMQNLTHDDLSNLNIRAPRHMARKPNGFRMELDSEQAVKNVTECMTMKKLKGTRKSSGDAQKTNNNGLERSEHTGNGMSTRSKSGVSESEQRPVVSDGDNEEDELMDKLCDDSVHLLHVEETKRIQDLQKVSGRLQKFQVGKEGCKCIET